MIEVVIYSKPGCCLCNEVKAQLEKLGKTVQFELREFNIENDPQAFEQFKEEIPVVFINRRKAFKYHLDEGEFLKRINRLLAEEGPGEHAS